MAEHANTAVVEVPASGHGEGDAHGDVNLFKPDALIMGLTWLTFLLTTIVLYKVAWKPILAALDKREADIRQSLEDAQKHRDALAQLDDQRKQVIAEADAKAKDIVTQARQAAVEATAVIEGKAREEAQILLANAQRELKAAHEKALAELRRESADLAIGLSRKIIGESLDEKKSRDLVDRLIKTV